MLITDKFIFIHMPKSGGTFVLDVIWKLYGKFQMRPLKSLDHDLPDPREEFSIRTKFKHPTRSHIPEAFKELPVVGSVRNPYDRYVSQYRFASWLDKPSQFPGLQEHPHFPNLSFSDYVKLANDHLWLINNRDAYLEQSIGWQTCSLLHWFGHEELHRKMSSGLVLDGDIIRKYLDPIVLLHTDNLNGDLFTVLKNLGYEEERIRFILTTPKIVPAPRSYSYEMMRNPDERWEDAYDTDLKNFVREKERFMFELFPHWDV